MNKKLIRLTESDLRKIINESVKSILKEGKYLPNGYDEEWENNVDDDSNKYVDFNRPSMFGFPTLEYPYKNAKKRLDRLNDTDSVAYPDGTIFGRNPNHNDYGGYYSYDEYGNKQYEPFGHYYDGIGYGSDDWDYDKNQPNWKTELDRPYQWRIKPSEFAKDERNINRKSYMGKNGTYEKDLNKMRMNDANNYKRALNAADKRPLHRKGSLNRGL